MKQFFTPCMWYNAQAKDAATLYCSVFADSKVVSQSSMVTVVSASGYNFVLLDGGSMFKPNPSISFYYICETEAELNKIWNAFSDGGNILMPLDKYPWGEKYGWIADKFGVSWQLALGKISDVGQKITPSLMFTQSMFGRADEAIKHYTTIFKESSIDGISRYGAEAGKQEEGKVSHARLSIHGDKLMLMESSAQHKFVFSEGMSLTIYCETQEEIDYYWSRLTEGGQESMCGWLKDKFGVSWQIVPTILGKLMSDPDKARKAADAFLKMTKFNIKELEQATM